MKKNILFVINPIAGGKSKEHLHQLIEGELDGSLFDHDFAYTQSVDHARKLSKSAAYLGFDIVVAVGGDGTVNEVARGILGLRHQHQAIMAIIPYGSGNGLARYLNIPLNVTHAIRTINKLNTTKIDSAEMNGKRFVNVAGVGFDAHISHLFANDKTRGLIGYAKTTLQQLKNYQPQTYTIEINGETIVQKAFLISLANSNQYGNNAYVSPKASASDGLLDLCMLRPFPLIKFPLIVLQLMCGRIDRSPYLRIAQGNHIKICRESSGPVHLDGEPEIMENDLEIKVFPLSVEIVVP